MTTTRSQRLNATDAAILAILAVVGWSLWLWAEGRGNAEAWDHDVFWSVVLPVMALASAIAGWLRPGVARLAGIALVVPQAVTLFATSGLAPLALAGLLFFAVFAVGFTGIAIIAASLRRRADRRTGARKPG